MNAPARLPLRAKFGHVSSWVFDLDNTLYPPDSALWAQIENRITLFLMQHSGLDAASAQALQRYYYHRHGTSLRGLVDEDGQDPHAFLDFVHDIDRSGLAPNPALAHEVARLPGRKFIFTNGSRNHALATTARLGMSGLFDAVFDIVDADLAPKPLREAYDAFFRVNRVDPAGAAMFEDIAKNLAVPRECGMTTVMVTGKPGHVDFRQAEDRALAPAFVDFTTDDLAGFLTRVNDELALKP